MGQPSDPLNYVIDETPSIQEDRYIQEVFFHNENRPESPKQKAKASERNENLIYVYF